MTQRALRPPKRAWFVTSVVAFVPALLFRLTFVARAALELTSSPSVGQEALGVLLFVATVGSVVLLPVVVGWRSRRTHVREVFALAVVVTVAGLSSWVDPTPSLQLTALASLASLSLYALAGATGWAWARAFRWPAALLAVVTGVVGYYTWIVIGIVMYFE